MSYDLPDPPFDPQKTAAGIARSGSASHAHLAAQTRIQYEVFWGLGVRTRDEQQATLAALGPLVGRIMADYTATVNLIARLDASLISADGPLPPKYHASPYEWTPDPATGLPVLGDLKPVWADPGDGDE